MKSQIQLDSTMARFTFKRRVGRALVNIPDNQIRETIKRLMSPTIAANGVRIEPEVPLDLRTIPHIVHCL